MEPRTSDGKHRHQKRLDAFLSLEMPKNVSVIHPAAMPGLILLAHAPDENAVALRIAYKNRAGGCFSVFLPVMFCLVAAKFAAAGFFADSQSLFRAGVWFLVVLLFSGMLYALFMMRRTYLLVERDWLSLHEPGLFGARSVEMETARISCVRRDIVHGGKDAWKGQQLAVVHDGAYVAIATSEHATAWLARFLGAATGAPVVGNIEI